ncbi:hypothetical protein [Chitinasiproducens palmae]|uniref:hypothetical protein n=1 Tax=Chitinasiproducens palmae TaxID=1770053 RepID=UPI001114571C|nr:hypothetical protein [Chitinasiproducens palmae]
MTVESGEVTEPTPSLLGDSGFNALRPGSAGGDLAAWDIGDEIPVAGRRALKARASLSEISGLLRVRIDSPVLGGSDAWWILARAAEALASLVVRDAGGISAAQFEADKRLALEQAQRYRADKAIVMLQALSWDDVRRARHALTSAVLARELVSYCENGHVPVWLAVVPHTNG